MTEDEYTIIDLTCHGWMCRIITLQSNGTCLKIRAYCGTCGTKFTRYYDLAEQKFVEHCQHTYGGPPCLSDKST